jgi:hypothetical protein
VLRSYRVAIYRVVVVAGDWSFIFGCAGCASAGLRVMFGPSAPLLGSGAAGGMPAAVGVCDFFCGGCVIAGGAFW